MPETFDAYYKWLGIPPEDQPPNHYRLLGIRIFEPDADVITSAADKQMSHLRTFQTGQHSALSQKLLNEVATAKVCLLNPEKKIAYDQSLRQKVRPTFLPTAQPLPDPSEAALAEVFQTRIASTSAIALKGRGKKPQPKSTAFIAAAGLTVVALGLAGLWWAFGHDNTPTDTGIAKVAAPATSATPHKEVSPKLPGPSKTDSPTAASTEPKEESQVDVSKIPPDPKPPAPKAEEETTPAPIAGKTVAAKPASGNSPADRPERSEEPALAKKLVPPPVDEQKRLMGEIDEIYKPGEAKDRVAKAALAHKLLEDGRKNEANRAEQFVLLRRAGEMARDAGEVDLMLEAVDAIAAAGFDIRPFQVKARLLKQLVAQNSTGSVSQLSGVAESCVKFAVEAASGGAIGEASDVLDVAGKSLAKPLVQAQTAQRAAKAALARARPADKAEHQKKFMEAEAALEAIKSAQSALAECANSIKKALREREAIQAAQERLKVAPDDADACLAVGRWYCFHQGDWDQGLKLLAKGSDAALKSLATEELASKPATADERVARGDAWWSQAEKATGRPKAAMQRRAGQWYEEALPDLAPGLAKTKVEGRLAQVHKEGTPDAEIAASAARPPLAKAPFDEKTAKTHQARWARYLRVAVTETNSIGMKMAIIPPGEFEMGSSQELIDDEAKTYAKDEWYPDCLPGEGPAHRVRITKPFWLGVTEVTQEQYQAVMGSNPSHFQGDPKRPVERVTGDQAIEFCRRLSELPREKAAKRQYRLPSEAQWEYACRAGSTGRWIFSDPAHPLSRAAEEKLLGDYAWIGCGTTQPVGQKRANAWGLYDMYGNVFEWCQDWYEPHYYANSPADDPTGPAEGSFRPCRGGSWFLPPRYSRSAFRWRHPTVAYRDDLGFRVTAALPDKSGQ